MEQIHADLLVEGAALLVDPGRVCLGTVDGVGELKRLYVDPRAAGAASAGASSSS